MRVMHASAVAVEKRSEPEKVILRWGLREAVRRDGFRMREEGTSAKNIGVGEIKEYAGKVVSECACGVVGVYPSKCS